MDFVRSAACMAQQRAGGWGGPQQAPPRACQCRPAKGSRHMCAVQDSRVELMDHRLILYHREEAHLQGQGARHTQASNPVGRQQVQAGGCSQQVLKCNSGANVRQRKWRPIKSTQEKEMYSATSANTSDQSSGGRECGSTRRQKCQPQLCNHNDVAATSMMMLWCGSNGRSCKVQLLRLF